MSFLAWSTPVELALLGATAAAIVLLYWLKPPVRRLVVPSGIVWSRLLAERKRTTDRLRWWLSLLLALAIGLSIGLALGRPELQTLSGPERRVAIVIDTSPTLRTRTADGRTRWDRAVAVVREILRGGGGRSRFLLVDTSGQRPAAEPADRQTALESLGRLRPSVESGGRFPKIPSGYSEIYFVSDGVMIDPAELPETGRWLSVFEPADNVGISAFEVRPLPADPQSHEAYLEVVRSSPASGEVRIEIHGAGASVLERTLRIPEGGKRGEVFDLSGFERGPIRARIAGPADALALDNQAYSHLPHRRGRRVVLVTPGSRYLETSLGLDREVELLVRSPSEELPPADAYVFDRYAPEAPPSAPAILFAPPGAPWLPPLGAELARPRLAGAEMETEHPVLEYVSLADLFIERARRIEIDGGGGEGRSLLRADGAALMASGERPLRWVLLGFSLEESNLALQAGFPIFLSNALRWVTGGELPLSRRLGWVEIPMPGARIVGLDGRELPGYSFAQRTGFFAFEPGLYTATRGRQRFYVAVNAVDERISRVNATRRSAEAPPASTMRIGAVPTVVEGRRWAGGVWKLLLVAALVLTLFEWWSFHRRMTV